jgi:transcriptional regulator with XRE-family HTH domain
MPANPRSRLGKMIRLYCDAHNISERELAKELGIDKATFNRLLHGHEINLGHFVPLLQWLLCR